MSVPVKVLINGFELTPPVATSDKAAQWDLDFEERIDGVGQAHVTIQDRLNDPLREFGASNTVPGSEPPQHTGGLWTVGWRDILQLKTTAGDINLFAGEILQSNLSLPAGFPWRRWKLTATDWNSLLDQRLVGAPQGSTWETIDGGVTYQVVDPNAKGLSTDVDTLQNLFDVYVRKPVYPHTYPDGGTFDTSSFVRSWIPSDVMTDPATGESRLQWTNTTLRSALDEMRGLASFPLFCWIDPDDAVHWMAFQSWDLIAGFGLPLLAPSVPFVTSAPARITDVTDDLNGSTVIGGRNLTFDYDSSYQPQEVFVNGINDFIYSGGYTIFQGTGWDDGAAEASTPIHPWFRQMSLDAQTSTVRERRAVARSYINYARRARLRGSVTVGKPDEAVDGWRCGQLLTITDARLPDGLNGHAFPIQRVAGKLHAGNDFIEYTLEFGDFPIARFSQKYRTTPQRIATARLPATRHHVELPTHHLLPSESYTLYSQMVDHSGKPVRMSGIPVVWTLSVTDNAGAPVSAGYVVPIASPCVTDQHGRTAATLTTGSTTGLHYHVTATTPAQS
jgi:hypothetical protein